MRGLMRLLVMFGPMIFRQFQKMQRNKARQQPTQYPDRQIERGPRSNRDPRNPRHDRGEQVQYKDLNAELGRPTAEERDFNLTDEDIMLDKDDLRHYDPNDLSTHSPEAIEKAVDDKIETLKGAEKEAAIKAKKEALDNDLDLRKMFLD